MALPKPDLIDTKNSISAIVKINFASINTMNIKVIVWQEEDVWCATVPALPGCHTWGESYEHLMEMVKEAVEGWLEVANEKELPTDNQKLVEISV